MTTLAALTLALAGAMTAVAAPPANLEIAQNAQVAPVAPLGPIVGEGQAPLSTVEVINGIEVMNGGANIADANYLKSRGAEFGLRFVFSGRGGEYGVAERLTLLNGDREVVSVLAAGPYVMLKVPPGRYTAEATFKGVVERRSVVVGNSATLISWNTPRASD